MPATAMTGKERMTRILQRREVDRIGLFEHWWPETMKLWTEGGLVGDEGLNDHFGFDMHCRWVANLVADLDKEPEVVEETEETKLVRDGNGALLRRHKKHSSTPEHVDFLVTDRDGWEKHIRPHVINAADDPRRVDFAGYRESREHAARNDLYFCYSGIAVFEAMHPVCGHEHMLAGMALDPDWVKDMCEVYSDLIVRLMTLLFEHEGMPDGVWFYEDLGFKQRPFMSPAMYRDIVWPAHKKLFDFAHERDLPVIVHSCGFVEPLVAGLIDAGMDMLQAMEVKAGMDLLQLKRDYGERISFMGGLDVRPLVANDRDAIEAELQAKVPAAMAGGGYCLHSDHSIPPEVEYDTYRFFRDRGLEIGTY